MMPPSGWTVERRRPPSGRVPHRKEERVRLLRLVRAYVERLKPVPPLALRDLLAHTDALLAEARAGGQYRDYCAVLFNNEVWKEQLARYPYDRRLLLLPKCLRDEARCPAPVDELGLVCQGCGSCPIHELGAEAERLGYAVMVAEGSPVVTAMLESGQVDAVVGVSCLTVLERVFPYMEAGAVPGVAIPLLNEGCRDTTVDLDWVWDAIHVRSNDPVRALDLERLKATVQSYFAPEALAATLGQAGGTTEEIARDWLAKAGKRWRPFLAACAYQALQEAPAAPPPEAFRAVAVAIECFHKASLVHDDIEDHDAQRYGEKTLHEEHGVPVALNVGDLLLGEGYRLLAGTSLAAETRAAMLAAVAEGHRALCLGQGAELCWRRSPRPLAPAEVIDIFRLKTAPAFEVALRVGSLAAGAREGLWPALRAYSAAVGVAYQIQDDLEDMAGKDSDVEALRPSLLVALGYERARGEARRALEAVWRRAAGGAGAGVPALLEEIGAVELARELLDHYKYEAIRALAGIENPQLKMVLRRVVSKIFNELEVMGCCDEHRAGDALRGERGAEAAA